MKEFNRQEIFNTVAEHLLTQGRQAKKADNSSCVYRSTNGDKCAIGCLIPDDRYSPKLENNTALTLHTRIYTNGLSYLEQALGYSINAKDAIFLRDLQRIHDQTVPANWIQKLKEFAVENNLTQPLCLL